MVMGMNPALDGYVGFGFGEGIEDHGDFLGHVFRGLIGKHVTQTLVEFLQRQRFILF